MVIHSIFDFSIKWMTVQNTRFIFEKKKLFKWKQQKIILNKSTYIEIKTNINKYLSLKKTLECNKKASLKVVGYLRV